MHFIISDLEHTGSFHVNSTQSPESRGFDLSPAATAGTGWQQNLQKQEEEVEENGYDISPADKVSFSTMVQISRRMNFFIDGLTEVTDLSYVLAHLCSCMLGSYPLPSINLSVCLKGHIGQKSCGSRPKVTWVKVSLKSMIFADGLTSTSIKLLHSNNKLKVFANRTEIEMNLLK